MTKHTLRIDLIVLGHSRKKRSSNMLTRLVDGKVTWSIAADNIGSIRQSREYCCISPKHPSGEDDLIAESQFYVSEVLWLLRLGLDNSVEIETP